MSPYTKRRLIVAAVLGGFFALWYVLAKLGALPW